MIHQPYSSNVVQLGVSTCQQNKTKYVSNAEKYTGHEI